MLSKTIETRLHAGRQPSTGGPFANRFRSFLKTGLYHESRHELLTLIYTRDKLA